MNLPFLPASEDHIAEVGQSTAEWQYPLDMNRLLLPRPASTFLLRADSNRLGVRRGDILVVDRSLTPERGRLVIAVDEGDMHVAKFPATEVWGVVAYIIRRV